ncbi:hypothetical protein HC766_07590 [Candidatus Gracilibacteria bacterium]|nr:hypothetical protein [Candidatus Gracilibacteria bacterium]
MTVYKNITVISGRAGSPRSLIASRSTNKAALPAHKGFRRTKTKEIGFFYQVWGLRSGIVAKSLVFDCTWV